MRGVLNTHRGERHVLRCGQQNAVARDVLNRASRSVVRAITGDGETAGGAVERDAVGCAIGRHADERDRAA